MSYPDYELNEPTTQVDILKMLELIYKKMNTENVTDKLFYIKIPMDETTDYLNYDNKNDVYLLSTKEELEEYQTKFTQEEIDKMKEDIRLNWLNISQCKVPVEEDE